MTDETNQIARRTETREIVVCDPFAPDTFHADPQAVIASMQSRKTLRAAQYDALGDLADAPTDAAKVPYFRRRPAIRTAAEYWSNYDPAKDGERGYVQMMINTRNALEANGYPIVEFEGHATRPIDADCAEEAARVFADAIGDMQIEPSCVFGNIALKHDTGLPQADRKDWKVRTMREFDAVMAERDSTYCFSIHPCMMQQPDFVNAMDALFPNKSRYELW